MEKNNSLEMKDYGFNRLIDISSFLPSTDKSTILESLYEETNAVVLSNEDFLNLPLNEEYKKNKELREKAEKEKKLND
jgi:3-dehydroquinate dehydratase